MKYADKYLQTAISLLNVYDGAMPLAAFLKNYFAQHKKYGSKDRKYIAQLCYTYFRLGHAAKSFSKEDAVITALFLCNEEAGIWSGLFPEQWISHWEPELNKRIQYVLSVFPQFDIQQIFPFKLLLSEGIDYSAFNQSHLTQPDLFLRIRPKKHNQVANTLIRAAIPFKQLTDSALALPNATKLEGLLAIDRDVIIQDYSSQRIAGFFEEISARGPLSVWDCCAASGGKSILAKDFFENIRLTVSDVRASILHNLDERFQRAGIKDYQKTVRDLGHALSPVDKNNKVEKYDLIICDAPCSGSGTWGRTPEQLFFFEAEKADDFRKLQEKIILNVLPAMKENGYLLYITCSAFKNENEYMTDFIQQQVPCRLVKQSLIAGYKQKADTMYAALFQRKQETGN